MCFLLDLEVAYTSMFTNHWCALYIVSGRNEGNVSFKALWRSLFLLNFSLDLGPEMDKLIFCLLWMYLIGDCDYSILCFIIDDFLILLDHSRISILSNMLYSYLSIQFLVELYRIMFNATQIKWKRVTIWWQKFIFSREEMLTFFKCTIDFEI